MISYWGVEHGDDISKGFRLPKLRAKKVAPNKPSGPQPPDYDFGPGAGPAPDLWSKPKPKAAPSRPADYGSVAPWAKNPTAKEKLTGRKSKSTEVWVPDAGHHGGGHMHRPGRKGTW